MIVRVQDFIANLFLPLWTALYFAAYFVLFLLPGLAVAALVAERRERMPIYQLLILVIVSSSIVGYVAFWIYFANKTCGQVFSYSVTALAIFTVAYQLRRSQTRILFRSIGTPILYVFTIGFCYLCLFFLFSNPFQTRVDLANFRFFRSERPGDNLIPLFFAEKIYDRQPLSPICCGDWLSSDRPPLQTGIFLFERPLRIFGSTGLHYQVVATGLQCLWVAGIWSFLYATRTRSRHITGALLFLSFSGFFFFNSVYVWPKLLAATFLFFVCAILFDKVTTRCNLTIFDAVLIGANLSLAFLAHPGSLFSLPAVLLFALINSIRANLRQCAVIGGLAALFLLPWVAYQKLVDPPGNRLLKMHLAGVGAIDSRSTLQAVRDSYGTLTAKSILNNKWSNITTLFGVRTLDRNSRLESARVAQRDFIFDALGVLNVGWLAVFTTLLVKKHGPAIPYSGQMLVGSLINLLFWSLVLFGPNHTIIAAGSYTDVLMLSLALLGFILALPRLIVISVLMLQLLSFWLVWLYFRPLGLEASGVTRTSAIQWGLLGSAIACAAALLWRFSQSCFDSRPTDG